MDCLICFLNGETAWLVDIDMHDVYVSYGMNCIFMDDTWVKVNGAVATRTCSFYVVVLFHMCTLNSYCYATVLVINYITLSTECTTLFFKASSVTRTIARSAHLMLENKLGWPSEKKKTYLKPFLYYILQYSIFKIKWNKVEYG